MQIQPSRKQLYFEEIVDFEQNELRAVLSERKLAINKASANYLEPFKTFEYLQPKSSLWLPEITPDNIDWVIQWALDAKESIQGYDPQTPSFIVGDPDFPVGEVEWDWEPTTRDRFNGSCTLDSWIDKSQPNTDLPDELHSFDQGLSQRTNDHLDNQHLNDRDFRQRCVEINGNLHILFERNGADFDLPAHHDPLYVQDCFKCQIDVALKIVQGFRDLSLGKRECLDILHHEDIDLRHFLPYELADYLEGMATAIQEPEWDMINNDQFPEEDPMSGSIYMIDEIINSIKHPALIDDTPAGQEPSPNIGSMPLDDIANDEQTDTFGTRMLYHEAEALSHEFLQAIRSASAERLAVLTSGFFQTEDNETGIVYPAKYSYLTNSQKSQAWVYMKERKQQLIEWHRTRLSPIAIKALHWMKQMADRQTAASIIYCCRGGRDFNLSGATISIAEKMPLGELSVLWFEYNKLFPRT